MKQTTPVRRKSASESAESEFYPPLEAPPKNTTLGGAIGEEDGSLNEEMAGTILKYILASLDPNLKAALKDLLKNDEGVMSTLKGNCK